MSRAPAIMLVGVNLLMLVFMAVVWMAISPPVYARYIPLPIEDYGGSADARYLRAENERMGRYVAVMESLSRSQTRFVRKSVILLLFPMAFSVALSFVLIARPPESTSASDAKNENA